MQRFTWINEQHLTISRFWFVGTRWRSDHHHQPCSVPWEVTGRGVSGTHGDGNHHRSGWLHWEDHDPVSGAIRSIAFHIDCRLVSFLSLSVFWSSGVKRLIMINRIQNKKNVVYIYVCVLCIFIMYIYIHKHACRYFRKICCLYIKCIYL